MTTNTAQGSLTMVGLNTAKPEVFWNGKKVEGIRSIKVNNDSLIAKVQLVMKGDATLTEMAAAGIEIKVGA